MGEEALELFQNQIELGGGGGRMDFSIDLRYYRYDVEKP